MGVADVLYLGRRNMDPDPARCSVEFPGHFPVFILVVVPQDLLLGVLLWCEAGQPDPRPVVETRARRYVARLLDLLEAGVTCVVV